ncbi:hypothetical protein CEXT_194381 [Caerostris extrusa]|uniref:Uncharacterized protein n=1 Tax=Caerostris extrusa TaxID=172846 RepID=A0AAV4MLT9_CAEEX|nr:hypothetical protein CEXT_194381 [Caerostris extrusa]
MFLPHHTHVSLFVHLVIGQLDFLERDHLFAKLVSSERAVRVSVQPGRGRRGQPFRPLATKTGGTRTGTVSGRQERCPAERHT